jgi:hypothetical protein
MDDRCLIARARRYSGDMSCRSASGTQHLLFLLLACSPACTGTIEHLGVQPGAQPSPSGTSDSGVAPPATGPAPVAPAPSTPPSPSIPPSGSGGSGAGQPKLDASPVVPRDGGVPREGCAAAAIPAEVQAVLAIRCQLCHGNPPLAPTPSSLVSYADFTRTAKSDPSKSTGDLVVGRIIANTPLRMPPPPAAPLTAAETETLRRWFEAGMPSSACPPAPAPGQGPPPPDAGAPPMGPNPFDAPARCTSGRNGTTGGSSQMNPGLACIDCHRGNSGPDFRIAGTVFPTAHEPNRCVADDSRGAQVTVVDSNGRTVTMNANGVGNFYSNSGLTPPLKAKVSFMGRERLMIGAVPHGDCNRCHTQAGSTTVNNGLKAPGRILLP